ncbi:MAG: alpha-ketoglutarate-dependent dioxygenase AlkB [Gallionella sp.]|jgi:alkylated DNA repair dioxygenase AlkB
MEEIIYVDEQDCFVSVVLNYITHLDSADLFTELTSLPLIKHQLRPMYGKDIFQPRLSICLNKEYAYSGTVHPCVPWSPLAEDLVNLINTEFKTEFNSAMVNYYPTGDDYISAHSDDERTLSEGSVFGVSVGDTRDMIMRWKNPSEKREKITIPLPAGSLFKMKGKTQQLMTHELPKRKRAKARGSLTLRKMA